MQPENKPNPGHPVSPAPTKLADSGLTAECLLSHRRQLWKTLRRRGLAHLVAEFAVDRVFHAAIPHVNNDPTAKPLGDWASWLFGSVALAGLQEAARSSCFKQCDPCVLEMASAPESVSESHEEVGAAFDALPDEEREVLDLTVVHELSFAEAGRRMKLKAYTVRRRHESGLRRLRLLLEEQYTGRK